MRTISAEMYALHRSSLIKASSHQFPTVKTLTLVRSFRKQVDFLADKLIFQQLALDWQVEIVMLHILRKNK